MSNQPMMPRTQTCRRASASVGNRRSGVVGVLLGGRHGDASLMAELPILRTDQNRAIRFKPPLLDEFASQLFNHGAMATEGVYRRA
jgi:hypothetical protein